MDNREIRAKAIAHVMLNEEAVRKQEEHIEVTAAEVFCVKCIEEELKKAHVRMSSAYGQTVVQKTTELLTCHKQEVRDMYRTSKAMLREWIAKESGVRDMAAFRKMIRMGLTGDIMKDMELPGVQV